MPGKVFKKLRETAAGAGRSLVTRPPVARMMQIHEQLTSGRHPNCTGIANRLEVSPKTISRDIEFMRDQLRLPIEYHARRHGYYYSEPVSKFPLLRISEGELIALMIAQKALEQYRGTAFESALASAFSKMTAGLASERKVAWGDLEDVVSFKPLGVAENDLEVFDKVSQAALECEEIGFEYRKLREKGRERRRVRPYHLGCVENQWYLFAFDVSRGGMRTFALARMSKVQVLETRFERPERFSLEEFLADSFSISEAHGTQEVVLVFRSVEALLVQERMWHPSQSFRKVRDGVEMRMRVGLSPELRRWILGWAPNVSVRGPESLALECAEAARGFLDAA